MSHTILTLLNPIFSSLEEIHELDLVCQGNAEMCSVVSAQDQDQEPFV